MGWALGFFSKCGCQITDSSPCSCPVCWAQASHRSVQHQVPWWSMMFHDGHGISIGHSKFTVFFFWREIPITSIRIHHLGFIKESSAARCWSRLMSHAGNRLVLLCTLQSPSPIHCSALIRGWKVHLCFHIHYVTMSTEGKHKITKYWHFTIQMVHELHQIPKSSRICRLHLAHLKLRVANNNKVTTSGQSASQIQTCKAWPATSLPHPITTTCDTCDTCDIWDPGVSLHAQNTCCWYSEGHTSRHDPRDPRDPAHFRESTSALWLELIEEPEEPDTGDIGLNRSNKWISW